MNAFPKTASEAALQQNVQWRRLSSQFTSPLLTTAAASFHILCTRLGAGPEADCLDEVRLLFKALIASNKSLPDINVWFREGTRGGSYSNVLRVEDCLYRLMIPRCLDYSIPIGWRMIFLDDSNILCWMFWVSSQQAFPSLSTNQNRCKTAYNVCNALSLKFILYSSTFSHRLQLLLDAE